MKNQFYIFRDPITEDTKSKIKIDRLILLQQMKIQLINASDKDFLLPIEKSLIYLYPKLQVNIKNHFVEINNFSNLNEPLFAIAYSYQENEISLQIIYSTILQYKFVWDLGRALHLQQLFINPSLSTEQLDSFENYLKRQFNDCKLIYLNSKKFRRVKQIVQNFKEIKRNVMSVNRGQEYYESQLIKNINQRYLQFQFRQFEPQDSKLGFFKLLNLLYQTSQVSIQKIVKHLQVMKASNISHVHFIGLDRNKKTIQAFGTLMAFNTIRGKEGKLVNLVISEKVRGKGLGIQLTKIINNEGWRLGCIKISLNCIQALIPYYVKTNFKFIKYNRLFSQFNFNDQQEKQIYFQEDY